MLYNIFLTKYIWWNKKYALLSHRDFFIVLDLRLTKDWLSGVTTFFFFRQSYILHIIHACPPL